MHKAACAGHCPISYKGVTRDSMALLNDKIRKEVQSMLADLPNPVTFKVFTQEFECEYCHETRELIEEVAAVSDKLSVEVYDFVKTRPWPTRWALTRSPPWRSSGRRITASGSTASRQATSSVR